VQAAADGNDVKVKKSESARLVFATGNGHKVREIQELTGTSFHILSLKDLGFTGEIPEDQDTIEGNAAKKAWFVFNTYKMNCFADDTGLEIDYLHGAPGVFSARYAGENCSFDDNMEKVLTGMMGAGNRNARFRTVIALVENGRLTSFQGEIRGVITTEKKGRNGFGYDPIFIPEGFDRTFAEMDPEEKNRISHRALAIRKLISHLQTKIT